MLPLGPENGTLLCSGRADTRTPVAALPDGSGGWLVVTRDPRTNPFDPHDGGDDIGLVHLDAALAPLPVNGDRGGDDPCGALLLGGDGHQTPFDAFAIGPGRFVVVGRELALAESTPRRVFALGFDTAGRSLFPDILATPPEPFPTTGSPFGAADGTGGFYMGWLEHGPGSTFDGRVLVARFDGTGRPLWPAPVVVSAGLLAIASFSRAVADPGGVFVSWLEPFPGDPDGYQPRVQHLDRAGAPSLPAGGVRIDPDRPIAGPALLAPWRPASGDAVSAGTGVIALAVAGVPRAHLIPADGSRPWGAGGVPLMPGLGGLVPRDVQCAVGPDGSLVVTWVESDGFMLQRLMARRLDADGRMPWPAPIPLLEGTGIVQRSEVSRADGTLVVAAAVYTLDTATRPTDIVAQAIDARGRAKTGPAGAAVCRADRRQWNALLMPEALGPASLLWTDNRMGIGVDEADSYFTRALTWTSAPRLAPPSVLPSLRQGDDLVLVIEGDDLAAGLAAAAGAGLAITSIAAEPILADGPGDRLVLAVRAAANARLGPRGLAIVNPDGGAFDLPAVLEVTLDPARIDIDGSGRADGFDLFVLAVSFGRSAADPGYAPAADIDGSGLVDGFDLALLAAKFGRRISRAGDQS